MDLAVSSIKDCWYKLSSRVGDYLSNYRLSVEVIDEVDSNSKSSTNNTNNNNNHHHYHHHHSHNHHHQHNNYRYQSNNNNYHYHQHACDQSSAKHTNSSTLKSINRQRLSTSTSSATACICQSKSMANFREPDRQIFYHNLNCPSATATTTTTSTTNKIDDRSRNLKTLNIDSSLPPDYRRRKTPSGQVYFVDPNGQKYWHDPSVPKELYTFSSIELDSLVGELSQEWELRQAPSGKIYYVNHTRRTTQFTDPRLVKYKDFLMKELKKGKTNSLLRRNVVNHLVDSSETGHQATTKNINRELFDKISILRQSLLKQQVIAHPCRIDVSRKKIFEDSYRVLSQLQPRDLRKRLLIKFRGEEGLDYGGVAREWFYRLSKQILSPAYGLFQYTGGDSYNLQINPDSGIVYKEHLSYLNFCGRVIGMAVFHGHFIEGRFTLPFYKMLLKKSITLGDIEFVDPELHRSLCWMLENDITNVIDTTFLVQHNAFGQLQEHELKFNGRNIVVTEDNKNEYVSLYVNYRCRRGIESQFEALQRGFYELISPKLLENFEEHELELLIGGLSKIDVEDWRLHTKLKNCTVETPLVRWFWDIVKSYDEDKRARLLQFVTGSPRVPIQGFKALQGVNSELRLFTIHLIKNACTDNLPKSHTCFNRIDLPPYESYERLRDKLTQAIEETMGFAMQ